MNWIPICLGSFQLQDENNEEILRLCLIRGDTWITYDQEKAKHFSAGSIEWAMRKAVELMK